MRKRSIALLLTGLLAGTLLLTPARAHFTENTRHLGQHTWQQFVRKRVFTRSQIRARFFTRNQIRARFPLRTEVHLPERTILVPGARTPTANGEALKQALAAIPGASADDPWLVRLEPGTFDLGGETLELPLFIDLEGSGRDATTIACDCTSPTDTEPGNAAVIFMNSPTELRSLSVVNDGPLSDPIRHGIDMVHFAGDEGRVTDVRVEVVGPTTDGATSSDGRAVGIWSKQANSRLKGVSVQTKSPGALISHGILAGNGGSIDVRDSDVTVSTNTTDAETFGIRANQTEVTVRDTSVDVSSAIGISADNAGLWNTNARAHYVDVRARVSGGFNNWAFYNEDALVGQTAIMQGIEALAIGGGDRYTAVTNDDAGAEISDSRLVAQGPNNIESETTGLRNRFSSTTTKDTLILVTNSTITSKGSFSAEGIDNSSNGSTGDVLLIFDNSTLSSQHFNNTTNAYEPTGRWFHGAGSSTFITAIGGSRLAGNGVLITGAGTVLTCAGVWDESNDFLAEACPDVL